jgi:hypothetical protein
MSQDELLDPGRGHREKHGKRRQGGRRPVEDHAPDAERRERTSVRVGVERRHLAGCTQYPGIDLTFVVGREIDDLSGHHRRRNGVGVELRLEIGRAVVESGVAVASPLRTCVFRKPHPS